MLAPISKGINNLLALATELERVHALYPDNNHKRGYYQPSFYHSCGTPACAIGHYAAMQGYYSYQDMLDKYGDDGFNVLGCEDFEITDDEWDELFEADGCGEARTALQAATYIRAFVARKVETLTPV